MKFIPRFQYLKFQVSIIIVILMLLSFTVLHWRVMVYLEEYAFTQLDIQLVNNLKYIEHQLSLRQTELSSLTRTLSTEITLKRALDRNSSRGVSQSLNRIVTIYPFFRYVLLFDGNQEVFAASTQDNQGVRIAGENALGLTALELEGFKGVLQEGSSISQLHIDPVAILFGIKRLKVQLYASPIKQRGEAIGWLIVCYNWQQEIDGLLKRTGQQLHNTGTSITSLSLWQAGNQLAKAKISVAQGPSPEYITKKQLFTVVDQEYELSISVDRQQILNQIKVISQTLTMFFGLSGISIFSLLYLGTDLLIIRRLYTIEKGAEIIRSGDLTYRIPKLGRDEIGRLANSFNVMSESIEEFWSSLEDKVQVRTKELHESNLTLKKQTQLLEKSKIKLTQQREELQESNQILENKQQQLKIANNKVELKARELEKTLDLTRRQKSDLDDFAHVVAHDLKAPLRGIRSLVDIITMDCSDKLDEDNKKNLSLLGNRAERMNNLIVGIGNYSRIGCQEAKKEMIDMNDIIKEAIDLLMPPNHIHIVIEDDLKIAFGNRTQLFQVFENLLSNAVKYLDKESGEITVSCTETGDFNQYTVQDNGPGIEEQYFDQIFGVFQTLNARDKMESTGIGLSIVKKLVDLHHGAIWLTSEPGQWTCFFVTLPNSERSFSTFTNS